MNHQSLGEWNLFILLLHMHIMSNGEEIEILCRCFCSHSTIGFISILSGYMLSLSYKLGVYGCHTQLVDKNTMQIFDEAWGQKSIAARQSFGEQASYFAIQIRSIVAYSTIIKCICVHNYFHIKSVVYL